MAARKFNWKRIVGYSVAALAALVLVTLAVAAVRVEAWASSQADTFEAQWSAQLERPVRIGELDVSPFSGVVQIAGFEVGAGEDEPEAAPEALTLDHVSVDLGMLRTLSSFGTHPYVESIALRGLQVNVVRLPDGTLNWQRISERLDRGQSQQRQEAPNERVQNTVVDVARLDDGEVAFIDLAREGGELRKQREARISAIDLLIEDAGYEQGMSMALQAAVLAQEQNLQLRASTSGVPEQGGAAAAPEIRELNLHMAPTELAPLAPFLAALGDGAGSTLEQGVLSADFVVNGGQAKTTAEGSIALANARFGRGERFDAQLALDLVADADAGRVDVNRAVLKAGEMSLVANGRVSGLGEVPQVQDVSVRSEGLSFDRIRALYPAFDRITDPAELGGAFAITATGAGGAEAQQVELELNMTPASVVVPERFRKPAGTPLVLHAELDARDDVVDVSELALQLAEFRMVGRGQVRDLRGDAARFQMRFETPSPEAGSLLRLLPEVASAIGKGREVPGKLAITGEAEGTSESFTAQAELALSELDVRAKNARFSGGGQATFAMVKQPQRWTAEASADFTQLRAVYPGVIRKPEPTPFTFEAELSGVPDRPQAFEAEVPEFAFAAGRSDIRGSMQLANLEDPQIAVQARSNYLDPDDFIPDREEPEQAPEEEEPSALAKADGLITLRADAGEASGVAFEELDAKLRLQNGRAKAETLRLSAFGGRLSGAGSEFPLFGTTGPVRVRGELEGMQTQGLLAQFADAPELLRGTLAGEVDVTASGFTLDELRESLTGRLSGSVGDAEFVPGSAYAALAERLQSLARVPALQQTLERATERIPGKGAWDLADLTGVLRFEDGAAIVQEPLTARTPQGELALDGRVSLSDESRLVGTWALEPEAIQSLIGTQLELDQPIPIELRIEGPLTQPRFAFGDIQPVVQQMVRAYGEKQLEGAAREGLEKALEETGLGDRLPLGNDDRETRGAKERDGKQGKEGEQKEEQPGAPEDKARREIEKRLPDLF